VIFENTIIEISFCTISSVVSVESRKWMWFLLTMGDAAVTREVENPVAIAMVLHINSKIEQVIL
jgi:hypothetical protein